MVSEDGVPVKTSGGLSPEWTNRKYKPEGLWAINRAETGGASFSEDELRDP